MRQAIVEKINSNGAPSGFLQGDSSSKKKEFDDSKAGLLKDALS